MFKPHIKRLHFNADFCEKRGFLINLSVKFKILPKIGNLAKNSKFYQKIQNFTKKFRKRNDAVF